MNANKIILNTYKILKLIISYYSIFFNKFLVFDFQKKKILYFHYLIEYRLNTLAENKLHAIIL
jgi:hypothetical protein